MTTAEGKNASLSFPLRRLLRSQLLTELTVLPNRSPVPQEHERNHPQQQPDEPQRTTRPSDPEPVVHGCRSKRQRHRKNAARARRSRHGARREDLIRIDDVIQQRHEYQEIRNAERDRGRHGHDPVDCRFGCPAQPEHAYDEEGSG
jgi:hypothetical protein